MKVSVGRVLAGAAAGATVCYLVGVFGGGGIGWQRGLGLQNALHWGIATAGALTIVGAIIGGVASRAGWPIILLPPLEPPREGPPADYRDDP